MTVSALVAMAAITGDQFAYLFEWRTVTALLILTAVGWSLVPWLTSPRARTIAAASVLAVVLVTSAFLVVRVTDLPTELRPDDHYVGRVSSLLADRAPTIGRLPRARHRHPGTRLRADAGRTSSTDAASRCASTSTSTSSTDRSA